VLAAVLVARYFRKGGGLAMLADDERADGRAPRPRPAGGRCNPPLSRIP
jgi:hypothetical protein